MRAARSAKKDVCFACVMLVTMLPLRCDDTGADAARPLPGVSIDREGMASVHRQLNAAIEAAPKEPMQTPGLVGSQGAARVRLVRSGTHDVLLPIPQLLESQVPVIFCIKTEPAAAAKDCLLAERAENNWVVRVRLAGDANDEVAIEWAAVVLIGPDRKAENHRPAEAYLEPTPCAQSPAEQVARLAEELWPDDGNVPAYLANIQRHIREMKQRRPPRSMDAVGILHSGANWICTANANLAVALLRAKDLPARSLAVIPTNGIRLEMHRIVEYHDGDRWIRFDPSSVHDEVPMKPWQSVVMAATTIADEEAAMKPRRGVALGCP